MANVTTPERRLKGASSTLRSEDLILECDGRVLRGLSLASRGRRGVAAASGLSEGLEKPKGRVY
jgi:hypothetical protein